MAPTTFNKSKDRFGLRSHAVPVIIAIAYLVESGEAKMSLLRIMTTILAACYIAVMVYSGIRMLIEIRNNRIADENNQAPGGNRRS